MTTKKSGQRGPALLEAVLNAPFEKKRKAPAIPAAGPEPQAVPQQPNGDYVFKVKPKRRRRRRSRSQVVAQRVLIDIRHKQRDFLRQASAMLSDALGFEVRVSLVRSKPDLSPAMRKASRMTRKQARRQIADSMHAPVTVKRRQNPAKSAGAGGLDDAIPF